MPPNSVVMADVPRDAEAYYPSEHAILRKRKRGIKWDWVSNTLESGRVHPSHKPDCRVFMDYIAERGELLKVIANVEEGEIVTVAWDDS